jgi:transposase
MDQRAELQRLRRDFQRLQQELAAAQAANFGLRERARTLEDENRALRSLNIELTQQLQQLSQLAKAQQQQLLTLQQRLDALDLPPSKPPADPPSWVKPNNPRQDRPPRRKRKPEHTNARKRDPNPTRVEQHALEHCPCCARQLSGGRLDRVRQVIELPPPQPVEVIEHQIIERWCGVCRRWRSPKLDLHEEVVGQGRIGVRLASLIAGLRFVGRLPLRIIQQLLQHLYSLKLSAGGLADLLQRLGQVITPAFEALLEQARGSPVLHMDETGWREDGENGYIWEVATAGPNPLRIYAYDHSRAGAVVTRLLGRAGEENSFKGVLISDFYGGYNEYAGVHQRCWVHLLRDLRELKQQHAAQAEVVRWAEEVRGLYDVGKEFAAALPQPSAAARASKYGQLCRELERLGRQFHKEEGHPCQTLAKRLLRHKEEMFQYVRLAGVAADNNLAERGIRPLVVSRKISGGSRSAAGTEAHMKLASLIGTWLARGQNPFEEMVKLLGRQITSNVALPQV